MSANKHLPVEPNHPVPESLVVDPNEKSSGDESNLSFGDVSVRDGGSVRLAFVERRAESIIESGCKVTSIEDLINKFNQSDCQSARVNCEMGPSARSTLNALSGHTWKPRKTIPDGMLGVYISGGLTKLCPSGHKVSLPLVHAGEKWCESIDLSNLESTKQVGPNRLILTVREGEIAGAERHGSRIDHVLFATGRHVLDLAVYRKVQVKKLTGNGIINFGPLSIVYVREGTIAGAYCNKFKEYTLFKYGQQYVFHQEDFQEIEIVPIDPFRTRIGPMTLLSVHENQMGGAISCVTNMYTLFPPGHTYLLHDKDYIQADVVERTLGLFSLGPLTFVPVVEGMVGGAYSKENGEWVELHAGSTYMLHADRFEKHELVMKNSNRIKCGPITYLSVEKGTLAGAYSIKGGFVEFPVSNPSDRLCGAYHPKSGRFVMDERLSQASAKEQAEALPTQVVRRGDEYVLHDKEFYDLQVIEQFRQEVQTFGPYTVITVSDGQAGVFERNGELVIESAGHFKLDANQKVRQIVSLETRTTRLSKLNFHTRDGIEMSVSGVVTWRIEDPKLVATRGGSFEELKEQIITQSTTALSTICRSYNREDLSPSAEDAAAETGPQRITSDVVTTAAVVPYDVGSEDDNEETAAAQQATGQFKHHTSTSVEDGNVVEHKIVQMITKIQDSCMDEMRVVAKELELGVNVISLKVERFDILDKDVIRDFASIARSRIEATRALAERDLAITKANAELDVAIKKAKGDRATEEEKSQAAAATYLCKAKAEAEAKILSAEADNKVKIILATTEAEAMAKVKLIETEAKVESIVKIAEAQYKAKELENKAAAERPESTVQLLLEEQHVKKMEALGSAAWAYPNHVQGQLEQLLSQMNIRYHVKQEVPHQNPQLPTQKSMAA